jgi:hypothetical protein
MHINYMYMLYDYVLCHILSSSDLTYEYMEWNKYVRIFCSLFDDTFSVTRLHSVDDRVTSEWWWWIDEDIHALSRIQARGLSVQGIKVYACSREATGTGSLCMYVCKVGRTTPSICLVCLSTYIVCLLVGLSKIYH